MIAKHDWEVARFMALQNESDFLDFLFGERENLDEVAKGIARQLEATKQPVSSLTAKQQYALFYAVSRLDSFHEVCSHCKNAIQWSEMPEGVCSCCTNSCRSIEKM